MAEMLSGPVAGAQAAAIDSYTDYKSLAARAGDESPEGIRKAAKQFESVFLHLWLKSMREANAAFGEGSYLAGPSVEAHQQMLDGEMALNLSNSGGIGLAEIIERQLSGLGTPVRRDVVEPGADFHAGNEAPTMPVDQAESARRSEPIPDAEEKRSFLDRLSGAVEGAIAGTPLPRLGVLAQAVLETGWGRHVAGAAGAAAGSGFNLFGIKATGWQGPSVVTSTREYLGGRFVQREEAFRAYDSIESAAADYVSVLKGSARYADLFGGALKAGVDGSVRGAEEALKEVRRFADTLQQGGYATDPGYADKIVNVARTILRLTGGQ